MNSSSTKGPLCQQQREAPSHFAVERDHLVRLAMTPGFWQHSKHRAMELERESVTHSHGMWLGIRAAVQAELKRLQFRQHPSELEPIE